MNDWVQTPEHPTNFYRTLLFKHIDNNHVVSLVGRKFAQTESNESGETRHERIIEDDNEVRSLIKEVFKLDIDYERFVPKDEYNLDMEHKRTRELLERKLNS